MSGNTPSWSVAIGLFVVFNGIAVPIAGRLTWIGITAMATSGQVFAATGLTVAVAAGILAINVVLIRDAARAGLPRLGQMAQWIFTGAQFASTIAAGTFSLLNLAMWLASG
ncbi:MAG: hypothetical protein AAFQ81_18805 [Pseudomonadota bacterium]